MASNLDLALRIQAATTGLSEISALIREIDKLGGETTDLEKEFEKLDKELAKLKAQQALIDQFRKIQQATTDTAKAFDAAKARVRELATQLNATSVPSEKLKNEFKAATAEAQKLQNSLAQQKKALSEVSKQLAAAGIAESSLTAEQKRLEAAIAATAKAIADQTAKLKAARDAAEKAKQAQDQLRESAASTAGGFDTLKNAIIGAGIVEGIRRASELADEYAMISSRLELAVGGHEDLARALDDVKNIAVATFSDLQSTAKLYEKLTLAARQLGINQSQVADVTRVVAEGLKLGGASAQESSSAILQLSQSLGSGVLRGEEFNAVFEASSYVMSQIAKGLDVPIGALRTLAEQGALTADTVIKALMRQRDEIDQAFGQLPLTVGNAFQQLVTQFQVYIGEVNKGLGVTSTLAEGISFVGKNIEYLDSVLIGIVAGGLARFINTLTAASAGAGVAARAMTGLNAIWTTMRGPLGLGAVITVLGVFLQKLYDSKVNVDELTIAAKRNMDQLEGMSAAQMRAAEVIQNQLIRGLQDEKKAVDDHIISLQNEITTLENNIKVWQGQYNRILDSRKAKEDLTKTTEALTIEEGKSAEKSRELTTAQTDLKNIQDKLASSGKVIVDLGKKTEESYIAIRSRLDEVVKSSESRVRILETEAKRVDAETKLGTAYIGYLESETAKRRALLDPYEKQIELANEVVAEKQKETDTSVELFFKLDKELSSRKESVPVLEKEIETLKAQSVAKQSEVDATNLLIATLQNELTKKGSLSDVDQARLDVAKKTVVQQEASVLSTEQKISSTAKELDSLNQILPKQAEQLRLAEETVGTKAAEAVQAEANARMLELEAAALQGVVDGHKVAGEAAALSKEQLDQLKISYEAAARVVETLTQKQADGIVTQDQVNSAQDLAVQKLSLYKTALDDTLLRIEAQIAEAGRHASAIKTEYDVQLAQNEVTLAAAKARGDEVAQLRAESEAKQISADQAAALTKAMETELVVLQQQLELKKQQALTDKEISIEEQNVLATLQDSIIEKQLAIEVSAAHAQALQIEASSLLQVKDSSAAVMQTVADETKKTTEAITSQASSYDQLSESSQRAYQAQLQLLTSQPNYDLQNKSIQEYIQGVDSAAAKELSFADAVNRAIENLSGQGLESIYAQNELDALSRQAETFGETMTTAGADAIQALEDFRKEAADAVTELRQFIADANEDLLAQQQLEHEANLQRIAELAAVSQEAEALRSEAEAAEEARYKREIDRIKGSTTETVDALQTEQAAVESVASSYDSVASASETAQTTTQNLIDTLLSSLQGLDQATFSNLSGGLNTIADQLTFITQQANELRAAL